MEIVKKKYKVEIFIFVEKVWQIGKMQMERGVETI